MRLTVVSMAVCAGAEFKCKLCKTKSATIGNNKTNTKKYSADCRLKSGLRRSYTCFGCSSVGCTNVITGRICFRYSFDGCNSDTMFAAGTTCPPSCMARSNCRSALRLQRPQRPHQRCAAFTKKDGKHTSTTAHGHNCVLFIGSVKLVDCFR